MSQRKETFTSKEIARRPLANAVQVVGQFTFQNEDSTLLKSMSLLICELQESYVQGFKHKAMLDAPISTTSFDASTWLTAIDHPMGRDKRGFTLTLFLFHLET